MRTLLLAFCLIASICAYHIKQDFDVVIDSVEYTKIPPKFKAIFPDGAPIPTIETLKEIATKHEKRPFAGTEAILNDYADKIFTNLQNLLIHEGFDPFQLPDIHEGFNYTLIIVYHGELDLTLGWLSDLSTLHRGGDVRASYSTEEKRLAIDVPIAFDDLQFTYDFSAKIMGLGPVGGIAGKISDITVDVVIGFDSTTLQLSLDSFEIVNTGTINIDFNGNPLVDWLLNLLTDVITTLLHPLILTIVENVIRGGLEGAIDSINSAIDGFLNPTTPVPTTTVAFY